MNEIPPPNKINITYATVMLGAMFALAVAPAGLIVYFSKRQARQQHDNTRGL